MKYNLKKQNKEKHNTSKYKENSESELPPIVKSISGILKVPPDFNYKKELEKALSKKYLIDK